VRRNESQKSTDCSTAVAKFEQVRDSRNAKVRGLWKRGKRYYAQLRVELPDGRTAPRRFPLEGHDLNSARMELECKRKERKEGRLNPVGRRPCLEAAIANYFGSPTFLVKKPRTQKSERQALERWKKHAGAVRVDKISLKHLDDYRGKRLQAKNRKFTGRIGIAPRTINLDVIALRQVLSHAKLCGQIDNMMQFFSPRHGGSFKALRQRPAPRRPLLTREQFASLLEATNETVTKNAEILRYYLRFLALTGAREREALCIARRDVSFSARQVTIGASGDSKNSRARQIDFSDELEALLTELTAALPPDTSWLFPSAQRGSKDIHAHTLRESFKLVRDKAGPPWLGFHDLRHFFASQCVMAGTDFMTIAEWLGHSDGGILVGKVYGHLAAAHKQEAARKLKFFT
jgi:integrase